MKLISFRDRGSFRHSENILKRIQSQDFYRRLESYALLGLYALESATPIDSGDSAKSWTYKIIRTKNSASISYSNTNLTEGIPVVILVQYGHATKNGGFVKGIDFINPAIKPVFEEIRDEIWKEVTAP